ncbi:MAG TPA: ABC transporter permease, partial [Conexibacter sp.]|nr:ABC transporter permease [Conexibacter sp.]
MRAWRPAASAPGESASRIGLAAVAGLLLAFFSLRHSTFFTHDNATTIAVNMSSVTIAAIGASTLLVAGYVDLSIGSAYGLVGMVVAEVAVKSGSTVAAVLAGLGCGLLVGCVNATLVRLLRISPLIVTIGMLAVYRGLAFVVSDSSIYGFPTSFTDIGQGELAGIPYVVIIAVAVFVVVGFALTRTVTGLRVYAIGGDARAAERAGVHVNRTVFGLYAFNGMLIGLVAVLTAARLGSSDPGLGNQFEFDVLTAAILGGVAFTGGAGRPLGVFIGVATIGIVNAGLVFEGLADFWQEIAKGSILILALAADQIAAARRARVAVRRGADAPSAPDDAPAALARADDEQQARAFDPDAPELLRVEHASKAYGAIR